jgi:hypothetical protein
LLARQEPTLFSGPRSLSRALRHQDPHVRQSAVVELANMGPLAAKILRRALADRRHWTRETAIQAYQAMGPQAVYLLIDNLKYPGAVARKSQQLLATYPASQSVPVLLEVLNARRPGLAWRAVNILIDIGNRVTGPLQEFLGQPGLSQAARRRADYILSRIYGHPTRLEIEQLLYWLLGSVVAAGLVLVVGLNDLPLVKQPVTELPLAERFASGAETLELRLGLSYLTWSMSVVVAWLMYRVTRSRVRHAREGLVLGRHVAEEIAVLIQVVLLGAVSVFTLLAALLAPVAAIYLIYQVWQLSRQRRRFERRMMRSKPGWKPSA